MMGEERWQKLEVWKHSDELAFLVYKRKGDKELARFVNISLGSLAETKYLLYFSNRLGYFEKNKYSKLKEGYNKLGKLLWKFYEKVKTN
jgi:four helix bundle protein